MEAAGMRSQHENSCYCLNGQRTGIADSYKNVTVSFVLLQAFYQIFADHNDSFPSLDYVDMVRRDQSVYIYPLTYSKNVFQWFILFYILFDSYCISLPTQTPWRVFFAP